MIAALAIALCLIWSGAGAKSVTNLDYTAMQRGKQIAKSCYENYKDSISEQYLCLSQAGLAIGSDNFAYLGFAYYSFIMEAGAEEGLRDSKTYAVRLKQRARESAKKHYDALVYFQRKFFVRIDDLCEILRSNCAMANRLAKYWQDHNH